MEKLGNYIITILFICFIFGLGILIQILPDRPASFYENRGLAQKPNMSVESIVDGNFTKEYENYFTDQFVGRDYWMQGYLGWQQMTNQTYFFKYYVSNDDWIYPKPLSYFAQSSIDRSIENMHEITNYAKERQIEIFFFSLPSRTNVLKAPFPSYIAEGYNMMSKSYFIDRLPYDYLTVINMGDIFKAKYTENELKDLYFQTDHHWNVYGAFSGYEIIYNTFNQKSSHFYEPIFNKDSYIEQCYDEENFLGSYNKQLYQLVDPSTDRACIITPIHFDGKDFQIFLGEPQSGEQVKWNEIYGKDLRKNKNIIEYSGLFTGDHREINIINPMKENENTKVLFIKDSYANPLTMWLPQHFYKTTFFDIRYNNDRSLYKYLEENEYDIIAFLYNDETLFSSMYDFHLQENH